MNKKQYTTVTVLLILCFNSLLFGNNYNNEDWSFNATATGNTTGHIGTLIITNNSSKAKTFLLDAYIIPAQNNKQAYAVYKNTAEQIEVKAGDSYHHKLNGYCININKPPAAEKEPFPPFSLWFSAKKSQTESTIKTFNFDTQLQQAAPFVFEAVKKLEENYFDWKSPLQIPDLYPGNARLVKEAIIQQAVWQFATALQGQSYAFKQFEQSIVEQQAVKEWLKLNGAATAVVADEAIINSSYFNYQCQKLWSIINDLNFYINPNSRALIPKWESQTNELEEKYIQFQALWENITLTGSQFKKKEEQKVIPTQKTKTAGNKKLITYLSSAIGAVGIVTGVVLLAGNKKGCTDKLACNYDEAAKKDDGSCDYGNTDCTNPCEPVTGCTNEAACNYNPLACVEDNSCVFDPCNEACLKKGTIRFNGCSAEKATTPYYFIEYEGELLDPLFDNCFHGFEGQEVLFNYETLASIAIDSINKNWLNFFNYESTFTCANIAQPVKLTCLPQNATSCNFKSGELLYSQCNGEEFPLIKLLEVAEIIAPSYLYCDFFFSYNEVNNQWQRNYQSGQRFKLDYVKANFDYECNSQIDAYIITCIEVENEETITNKTLNLFTQNQPVIMPAQTPEHFDEALSTNIAGINYYQPLGPTMFIQNQTSLANVQATNLYFLNNRLTFNTKNPYLPLYYGLGFNSRQLSNQPALTTRQNQLIWNVGMQLPILKKLQLQAEMHKTFKTEDNANCTIRLIYKQAKPQKSTNPKQ